MGTDKTGKKNITVVTATRAEFGLLKPVIEKLSASPSFIPNVVVTGTHLTSDFGSTYMEIEKSGINIERKIPILLESDMPAAISKTMGIAMISFADYFEEMKPDAVMVLGDRYETLAVCCAAMNARIPIIHLHGGEITEGAIDDEIRHAISKLSYLHMTSTEEYRERVIQLGEQPGRVFNVGALGVENCLHAQLLSLEELSDDLEFDITDGNYAVLTFHPVTLEDNTAEVQGRKLLSAISEYPQLKFIVTKANADAGGRIINQMFEKYAEKHQNVRVFSSLGIVRYLSAVKESKFVIGNSSSGIIEVPSFHIPTVNIGDRQKGRIRADSVIDCGNEKSEVISAIQMALSDTFRRSVAFCSNPYGDGNTSDRIVTIMKQKLIDEPVNLKKKFYDIVVE